MAPDGNGGVYRALLESGLLARLESAGVSSLFQLSVDNALCRVAEPMFVGYCAREGADCASKTVPKAHAHERVGVLALQRGRPCVLEYSEIDAQTAEARAADGGLLFGAAHICVNWFSLAFIRRVATDPACALPLHVARKMVRARPPPSEAGTAAGDGGARDVECIKLEQFIFDAFGFASKMVALQVARDDDFAPVKNAPGAATDSPDTARALLSNWAKRKVVAAGGALDREACEDERALLEVSPLLSYDGEGLEDAVRGKQLKLPLELR
jgi:UDP-N-acetylglucosamine/UDP-N-acetylgalactosamine diphosphorylase